MYEILSPVGKKVIDLVVFVKVEGKNLKVAGVSALYFPAEWQAN
jgi:hypothetical protein